jgi:hypothetical protein
MIATPFRRRPTHSGAGHRRQVAAVAAQIRHRKHFRSADEPRLIAAASRAQEGLATRLRRVTIDSRSRRGFLNKLSCHRSPFVREAGPAGHVARTRYARPPAVRWVAISWRNRTRRASVDSTPSDPLDPVRVAPTRPRAWPDDLLHGPRATVTVDGAPPAPITSLVVDAATTVV